MNYWGRIFFIYDDNEKLINIKGQPLENHTENCRIILEKFETSYFHKQSKDRLMQAVEQHDLGKKDTFRLRYEDSDEKRKKNSRFVYSFAGHRFRVPHDDPYIAGLIRSHHEFSVSQINREKARLSKEDKKTFADDLYLLCMADHLEAELAVKTIEGKEGVPRTFMEFITVKINDRSLNYTVEPWPFEPESFSLSFTLKELFLENIEKKDPKTIKEALNKSTEFKEDEITITLRRN